MIDVSIMKYFSNCIVSALKKISSYQCDICTEIRLRLGAPVVMRGLSKNIFLGLNGETTNIKDAIVCERDDIEYSFRAVCDNSVHSYEKEISQGFITVAGGHRVGICGTAVYSDDKIKTLKNISSMNFRIAHEITGCSEEIYNQIFNNGLHGVLISGAPLSGKTTFLRDLCRILSEKYRVSVVDERSEIAAVYMGEPQNKTGPFSDILDGYSKRDGIETAVRVMSPDVIICDEIGSENDITALSDTLNSGVKILASVHAKNETELLKRKKIMKLIQTGAFEYIVFLENEGRTSHTVKVEDFIKNGRQVS